MVALYVPILVVVFLGLLGAAIPLGILYSALWTPIISVILGMILTFAAVRAWVISIRNGRQGELQALRDALVDGVLSSGVTLPDLTERKEDSHTKTSSGSAAATEDGQHRVEKAADEIVVVKEVVSRRR
ncbi:MAG: hypothetical protein AAFX99_10730 [Myxococcota bacterium]